MKIKSFAMFALICLVAWSVASVQASDTGENRNLFKTAGQKENARDFAPAPDKIKTNLVR